MVKILFVCTGDTCRSPMAREIFNNKIKKNNIKNIKAYSGGIYVDPSETKLSSGARYALGFFGIKRVRHNARQISQDYMDEFSLIITMTIGQKNKLIELFPAAKNVYCMAELTQGVDVSDPYGKTNKEYLETARYLDHCTDQIFELLYKKGVLKW